MKIFDKKNSVKIENEDIRDAKLSSSGFADEETKKRAFVNVLGARLAIKMLFEKKLEANNVYSFYTIQHILEKLDIADIYLNDLKIDVRLIFDENQIFIPKSHFKYNLLPDLYLILKLNEKITEASFLGFVKPEDIDKENQNADFYFCESDIVETPKKIKKFLKDFTPQPKTTELLPTEEIESLFIDLSDEEITEEDKINLLEQLAINIDLREKVVEFENFELLSKKASEDTSILNDEVLGVIGAQNLYEENNADENQNAEIHEEVLSDMLEYGDSEKPAEEENNEFISEISDTLQNEKEEDKNKDNTGLVAGGAIAAGAVGGAIAGFAAGSALNAEAGATTASAIGATGDILKGVGELAKSSTSDLQKESTSDNKLKEELPLEKVEDNSQEISQTIEQEKPIIEDDTEQTIPPETADNIQEPILEKNIEENNSIETNSEDEFNLDEELPEIDFGEIEDIKPIDEDITEEQTSENSDALNNENEEELQKDNIEEIKKDKEPENIIEETKETDEINEEPDFEKVKEELSKEEIPTLPPIDDFETPEYLKPFQNETSENVPEYLKNLQEETFNEEIPSDENAETEPKENLTFDDLKEKENSNDNISTSENEEIGALPELKLNFDDIEQPEYLKNIQNEENNEENAEENVLSLDSLDFNEISDEKQEKKSEGLNFDDLKLMPLDDEEEDSVKTEEKPQETSTTNEPSQENQDLDIDNSEALKVEEENEPEIEEENKNINAETVLEDSDNIISEVDNLLANMDVKNEQNRGFTDDALLAEAESLLGDTKSDLEETTAAEQIPETTNTEEFSEEISEENTEENTEDNTEENTLKVLFKDDKKLDDDLDFDKMFPTGKKFTEFVKKEKKVVIAASVVGVLFTTAVIGTIIHNKNNVPPDLAEQTSTEQPIGQPPQDLMNQQTQPNDGTLNGQGDLGQQDVSKNTQQVNKDMSQAVSDAFLSEPVNATISKIAWEVPEELAYNDGFRKYLQVAGGNLKLNLQNDLLLATDLIYSNKVVIDLSISNSGDLQSSSLVKSSGSKQVDAIVLQSVKNTLQYLKMPADELQGNSIKATLIINF